MNNQFNDTFPEYYWHGLQTALGIICERIKTKCTEDSTSPLAYIMSEYTRKKGYREFTHHIHMNYECTFLVDTENHRLDFLEIHHIPCCTLNIYTKNASDIALVFGMNIQGSFVYKEMCTEFKHTACSNTLSVLTDLFLQKYNTKAQ